MMTIEHTQTNLITIDLKVVTTTYKISMQAWNFAAPSHRSGGIGQTSYGYADRTSLIQRHIYTVTL